MQSWGTTSEWTDRDSGGEPSKSGVVGIIAAAQGRSRSLEIDDIAHLRMGVRVDLNGVHRGDYQTAGAGYGVAKATDSPPTIKQRWSSFQGNQRKARKNQHALISTRHHLQDAAFLVALEGPDHALLMDLDAALRAPVYPLGLGRRSYVPSIPIAMPDGEGVREGCIRSIFETEIWLPERPQLNARRFQYPQPERLRTVIETSELQPDAIRMDQPIGAAFKNRQFGPRGVKFGSVPVVHAPEKESNDDAN